MGDFALPENQRLLVWMQQAYASDERVTSIHQFYETFDARGEMTQRRMMEIRFALIAPDEFLARARQDWKLARCMAITTKRRSMLTRVHACFRR